MTRRDLTVTAPHRLQEGRSGYGVAAAGEEGERALTGQQEFEPENRSSTEAKNGNCWSKNRPLIISLIVIAAGLVIGAVVAVFFMFLRLLESVIREALLFLCVEKYLQKLLR
ncbi:unnamed protein product [Amoebophrya sp. A120]|nr:unnamed protein product [Amoebophrya sp. A120]|eukprot:GSA120T00026147001.1